MSTEDPTIQTEDPAAVERALRAGLTDYEPQDEDLALLHAATSRSMPRPVAARCRSSPSSAARTSASRPSSTASSAAARPSSRTSPASPATASPTPPTGRARRSRWSTPAAGRSTSPASRRASPSRPRSPIALADVVIFVVDATVGVTETRHPGRPAAAPGRQARRAVRQQGRRPRAARPTPPTSGPSASASRSRSPPCTAAARGDLLDAALDVLPEVSATARRSPTAPAASRCIGRPNVGKSSLLNKVLGAERVVVDYVAGTTRDPVDELVALKGKPWVFVDTAGIRRRVHQTSGADFYASLRTQAAHREGRGRRRPGRRLRETITEQDTARSSAGHRGRPRARHRVQQVGPHGRGPPPVPRARDRAGPRAGAVGAPREHLREDRLAHRPLVPALERRWTSWDTRISTGRLNAFLGELVAAHPHPLRGGKQPRILFATQASTRPPRFVHLRDRLPRPRLPPLHRASPARDVRLRGHADLDLGAGAGEALRADVGPDAGGRRGRFWPPRPWGKVSEAPAGAVTGCGAAW